MAGAEGFVKIIESVAPVLELVGGVQQAAAARTSARLEADRLDSEAEAERRAAERDRIQLREERVRTLASLRARAAAQGFRVDEGAPIVALSEQMFEFDRALTALNENADVRQVQLANQREATLFEGEQRASGALISAGSGFLTRGIKFLERKPPTKKTTESDVFMRGGAPF